VHSIERLERDATVRIGVLRGEQFLEVTLKVKPTDAPASETPSSEKSAKEK
jgi:hypothetical protein